MHLEQRSALRILTFASSVSKPGAQVRNLSLVSFPPFLREAQGSIKGLDFFVLCCAGTTLL